MDLRLLLGISMVELKFSPVLVSLNLTELSTRPLEPIPGFF